MPIARFGRYVFVSLASLALLGLAPRWTLGQSRHPKAGRSAPPNFETLAQQAASAREQDRSEEAVRLYLRALRLRPRWEEGWWYVGTLNYDADHYAEAISAFKQLLKVDPKYGEVWSLLGLSAYQLKDYPIALAALLKGEVLGAGREPNTSRVARYHLALLLIRNSEFHRAAQLLISELGRGQVPGQARFALGLADLRLPLLPDEVDPSRSTLIQEVGDAAALLAANKPDEGLQALAQTVKNHPDTPFLHYFYATALASQQRYEDSDAQLREETRVSPQSELAYLQLARNALWSRRYADALSASQHAVERAPQYGEAHYLLGRSLLELGKSEEAIKELENANGIAPNSPGVHFSLARAYAKTKQPEKAGQERGIFERLNAIVERQRSQQGGQAYGDAHHRSGLANPGKAPGDGTTPDQR